MAPWIADLMGGILLISLGLLYWITPIRSVAKLIETFCSFHYPLLLMRVSLIVATVLPSPVPECRDPVQYEACTACQDIHDMYPSYSTWYCNDLMFSGHTMTNLICWCFWIASPARKWMKICASVCCFTGVVALVIGRQHYTADIIVAIYITILFIYSRRETLYMVWIKSNND